MEEGEEQVKCADLQRHLTVGHFREEISAQVTRLIGKQLLCRILECLRRKGRLNKVKHFTIFLSVHFPPTPSPYAWCEDDFLFAFALSKKDTREHN